MVSHDGFGFCWRVKSLLELWVPFFIAKTQTEEMIRKEIEVKLFGIPGFPAAQATNAFLTRQLLVGDAVVVAVVVAVFRGGSGGHIWQRAGPRNNNAKAGGMLGSSTLLLHMEG